MANESVVRVGLIGLGAVCEAVHYPGFSRIPGVELVGLCDADEGLVHARQQAWGIEGGSSDVETFLRETAPDAVAIATPNRFHRSLLSAALKAGCHVLCEKPLALDFEETRLLYEEAIRSGKRHMTAFTYRFVPGMRYLHHLLAAGELGEIRHARFQRLQDWGEFFIGWRQYRDEAGSGELGDMGIHRIDCAESLLGPIKAVCASAKQVVPRDRTPAGLTCPPQDVEDWVAWIAEFESGATAVFEMGKLTKGRGPEGDHDVAELNGSKASATYHLHTPHEILFAQRGKPYETRPVPEEMLTYADSPRNPLDGDPVQTFRYDQAWEFISAIREDRECIPSFADGLRAQGVADAILTAVDERRWVECSPSSVGA